MPRYNSAMMRGLALALCGALLVQDAPDAAGEKSRLHEALASAAESAGEQLIKLKAWDEARAFLELIRAKSDARAEALDKLIAKTEKQTSGLKWDAKSSDLIKSFGAEQAKPFFAFAKRWKEKDAEVSRWTEAEAEILEDLLDYVKAYARLTQTRAHYELPMTAFDWKLSVPAYWHAEYKRLNPIDGMEEEGKPGYSHEGNASGRNSVTSRGQALTNLLESMIHGPFHRTMILNPRFAKTGFGQSNAHKSGSVIDVLSGLVKQATESTILAIPAHNADNVPPTCFDDNLPIIPDRPMRELGYPISLTFFDATQSPKEVRATILENLKEIEFYLSTPEKPALPRRYPDNRNTILLIPKSKLRQATEYTVRITYTIRGEAKTQAWQFKTGR